MNQRTRYVCQSVLYNRESRNSNYDDLQFIPWEMYKLYKTFQPRNIKVIVILTVVVALETVSKGPEKRLKKVEIKESRPSRS